ncbi:anti-sigma factor [Salinisphaera aquimarina]|uniref:Anti-sigma factor domain-containing protein n=1 Tax=Salinisphaera aquimarina TaxID=2094031 RepID=A0ABV7EL34_9GAMM
MAESDSQTPITQAGEYVLGTLDAQARGHLEQQLGHDTEARREVSYWEQRLGSLGLGLAPVTPPEHVWTRIEDQIAMGRTVPIGSGRQAAAPPKTSSGIGIWRGIALAASLAALVLAGLLVAGSGLRSGSSATVEPAYASVVYDQPTGMSWLVTAEQGSHIVSVLAMGDFDVPKGKVLRAWIKPDNGQPMPMGEWPHTNGDHQMTVSDAVAESMGDPAQLMVTMEDADVEDQAAPEGRLMWTSPIGRHTS